MPIIIQAISILAVFMLAVSILNGASTGAYNKTTLLRGAHHG